MKHDHTCNCGTASPNIHGPHQTGQCGCVRRMTTAPKKVGLHPELGCVMWDAGDRDGQPVTDYTLKSQRGYYEHPCGCWSHWCDSVNSIDA
jgi:hypothetical protein